MLPAGSAYLAIATAMVEVGPSDQRLETGLSLVASNPAVAKSQSSAKVTCSDAFSVGDAPSVGVTTGLSAIQIRS